MKLPDWIAGPERRDGFLGVQWDARGGVRVPAYTYPPPGYLGWTALEVGNGDGYGFYWPIGREEAEPIVCTLMHDSWDVVPVGSGLAGALRVLYASAEADEEDDWSGRGEVRALAREFGVSLVGAPSSLPEGLLQLDPRAPQLLLRAANEASGSGDLDRALAHLQTAVEVLPEYTAAHFALAQLHRRRREMVPALEAALLAFTSPDAFSNSGHRSRCLEQLRRAKDDAYPGCQDPIWLNRHGITLATGQKWNDDYALYEEAVEAYHALGWGVRAVRMRVLIGELMSSETVSFRERYGWSRATHFAKLRSDLSRAGLHSRLEALTFDA